METLIGRKFEAANLRAAYDSENAEFIIVYGRRRVGKTFLVRNVLNEKFDFCVTGLFKKTKKRQLENFANSLSEWSGMDIPTPKDWYEAFRELKRYLKTLNKSRKVVFIDEMPWMATPKSDFVSALENFWNGWGSGQDSLKLIVCGSASSWFANNVFSNKGGLFNRDTRRIYLSPFTLRETEDYLHSRGINLSRYSIAQCYMVMGGIPYYLSKLQKGLSLAQNIDRLFFYPKAILWDEFRHLYDALFSNSEYYVKVVESLAEGERTGLTQSEISEKTGIPLGGNLSHILENLKFSDIIASATYYGKDRKEERFILTDFYTLFYFKIIKGNNSNDKDFWTNRLDDPSLNVWKGLAFELLCMLNVDRIRAKLSIGGVATDIYSFASKEDKGTGTPGAQIDLVLDRRDQIVNLCEIKYSSSTFTINKRYHKILIDKIRAFKEWSNTKKAVHLVMVTTYGLSNSVHNDIVQSEVILDDLFE